MFPPVQAAFVGSAQDEGWQQDSAGVVERAFAALAMLAAVCAGLAASSLGQAGDWPWVLKLSSAALLVPSLLGLWLAGYLGQAQRASGRRLSDRMLALVHSNADGVGVPGAGWENGAGSLASLIGGVVGRLRRLQHAQARSRSQTEAANAALQAGRDGVRNLALNLRRDGALMADAASGLMAASARLAADTADARIGAGQAEGSMGALADQAVELAASVRLVTAQVGQMSEIAAGSADAALGAQQAVAAMDGRARAFGDVCDHVGRALRKAALCGMAAEAAGPQGQAALAVQLAEMAGAADAALCVMADAMAGLRTETTAAGRRVADLSALLASQQELGEALAYAVSQQGEEVGQVLALLGEAHAGFAVLRAGVDAISTSNEARLATAETLRGAANQVPAHADTIAGILRALPDFAPPLEY